MQREPYMLTVMRADLHTHSNASDGTLSPDELLAQAQAAGVELLSITDHDTVAGLHALQNHTNGCRLIPGIELSTNWRKTAIHVIGLNIDPNNETLGNGIERQQEARRQRASAIAAKLGKLGFTDTLEGATRIAGSAGIARPHFALHLVETGQVKSVKDAFRKYLGPGKAGDIRELWAELDEVMSWIHAAGGVAVLAHPAKYKLSNLKLEELTRDFRLAGGDALEVISGRQDSSLTVRLGKLANRHGLLASCGSDFHEPGRNWGQLGEVAALPAGCSPVWQDWINA
jgi:predicted metal-dependent phosphoesterase TrpH